MTANHTPTPLPCPFCGCDPILVSDDGGERPSWQINCLECGATPIVISYDSVADATALWNTRTDPAKAALVEACENLMSAYEDEMHSEYDYPNSNWSPERGRSDKDPCPDKAYLDARAAIRLAKGERA